MVLLPMPQSALRYWAVQSAPNAPRTVQLGPRSVSAPLIHAQNGNQNFLASVHLNKGNAPLSRVKSPLI